MARSFRHLLWIVALVAVTVFADGPARAADGVGQLAKVRGAVVIARSGRDDPAKVGAALQLHDTVKTGAKARAQIQFSDGSTVTLGENSALSIDRYSVKPGASRNVVLTAVEGLVNTVASKSGEAMFDYQVRTADGYSAVRGTNWITAAGPAGTTFSVVEGQVQVGVGSGNRVVVAAGSSIEISKAGGMGQPQPLVPDVRQQLLDATDVASANAAPDASEAPAAAPADPAAPDTTDSETETPAAPSNKPKSGGSGGGGGAGGGHGGGMH